ncbi:MAG: Gfo/Idh/MocA family oxidoreductase [Sedimentisphaerales bacterium]|nr:Gfo/Idh/MocA family oxidoreductase [Sedimentisphaerales bacterium]
MIKAGVIGLGKMGISHYSILNTHPDVDVVGVCDSSKFMLGCLGKLSDARYYNDYRKMLDACSLDCVMIATPTSSHKKIVCDCLERGLHVFVEKPFSLDIADGREMVDLALEKKVINQVGFHNKFVGAFNKAREVIEKNAIGEIYHITGEAYGQVVLKPKGSTWRSKKSEGGGCLHDYASHVIDLLVYYVGMPEAVSGTILKKIYSHDVEDAVYSTLLFPQGISGQLAINWSDESYRKMSIQITIFGKKGKIVVERQECKIFLRENGDDGLEKGWNILYTTELTKPVWFYLRGEEYSAQIDYFIKCISEGREENVNSFESAHKTDMIIDMLLEDARY